MTAFAAFGGILFGYDTGTISGIIQMEDWLKKFGHPVPVTSTNPYGLGITTSKESLVVSILSAGTFFGASLVLVLLGRLLILAVNLRRSCRCSVRR